MTIFLDYGAPHANKNIYIFKIIRRTLAKPTQQQCPLLVNIWFIRAAWRNLWELRAYGLFWCDMLLYSKLCIRSMLKWCDQLKILTHFFFILLYINPIQNRTPNALLWSTSPHCIYVFARFAYVAYMCDITFAMHSAVRWFCCCAATFWRLVSLM